MSVICPAKSVAGPMGVLCSTSPVSSAASPIENDLNLCPSGVSVFHNRTPSGAQSVRSRCACAAAKVVVSCCRRASATHGQNGSKCLIESFLFESTSVKQTTYVPLSELTAIKQC